jgi:hypothetical protein
MKLKPFFLSLTSSIIFTSAFLYSTGYAGFNKIIKKEIKNQIKVTTENGVIDPNLIIELEPENNIKIVTSDGTHFDCLVKVVKYENNTTCKIFGDVLNKDKSAFGFALSKSGSFAGAILFKNESYLYTVEHSEKIGGFVFVKKNIETGEPPQRSVVGK